jgi:hypothetical protein
MEPTARDVHVLRLSRYFQQLQDTRTFPDLIGADPPCLPAEFFKAFMPEAAERS